MTGGIGFSRLGQDSFKNNRKLLNNRILMKDNPYSATSSNPSGHYSSNYDELKHWKISYRRKAKRLRLIIYFGLIIVLAAFIVSIYLLT